MTPIKTGGQIYIQEFRTYHVGDIYQVGSAYICKCNPRDSFEPIRDTVHLIVDKIEELWLQDWHIIICLQENANYLGYDGQHLKKAFSDGR